MGHHSFEYHEDVGEFYRANKLGIRRLCLYMGADYDDLDDLIQDVMMHFLKCGILKRYDPDRSNLNFYISMVIKGTMTSRYKRNKARTDRIQSIPTDDIDQAPPARQDPEDRLIGKMYCENLLRDLKASSEVAYKATLMIEAGYSAAKAMSHLGKSQSYFYWARGKIPRKYFKS